MVEKEGKLVTMTMSFKPDDNSKLSWTNKRIRRIQRKQRAIASQIANLPHLALDRPEAKLLLKISEKVFDREINKGTETIVRISEKEYEPLRNLGWLDLVVYTTNKPTSKVVITRLGSEVVDILSERKGLLRKTS